MTVEDDEKIQFEMTVDNVGSGALIGFSEEGTDGNPGPGIVGAVYDSTGNIRYTGNWSTGPTGTSYTTADIVGATLNNTTGEITFYKNGVKQPSVFVTPNRPYKLYVHSNLGQVTANFGASGFTYPVDGFSNFERYEPAGIIGSIDVAGLTITMSKVYGDWGPANDGHYAIGPKKQIDAGEQYLKLDQATLNVIELQSAETPYTPIDTAAPKIKFGATLGTADTPDVLLPPGTSIQTEIKAANGIAPDSIVQSDPVTPISVFGPTATMYGLRFDSARDTNLSRSGSGTGTISYWKKDTGTNPQWEYVHQTGVPFPTEIGAGYDGYMSDYYFVENQDLPPETFGEDFQGKWGPLDSEVVKTNIGDFGTNGFFLPFNPDAPSVNYEGRASIDSAWAAGKGPGNVFDGELTTAAEGTANNETATFKLGQSITSTKVRINHQTTGNFTLFDADNNVLATEYFNRTLPAWDEIYVGADIEVAKITVQATSNVVIIYAIEINDDVLTDHGVIGYDASGNNNHFIDENFIPFTLDQPDTNLLTGEIEPGYPLENAFDGDLTTYTRPKGSAEARVDLLVPYTNIKTLRFYIKNESTDATLDTDCFKVNQIDYSYLVSQTARWVDIPEVDFESFSMRSNGVSSVPNIFSIEIDGVLFGQRGTVNQDLVKDTPMTSYAVLNTGANGNLEATSVTSITYLGEAGTDYYYEEDGVGKIHTGAGAFTSVSGKTYNFGQQPFAETPTAEGRLFQTWPQWNDYVTLFADNPEHVAKFEAIKEALESYEGDRLEYRAELRQRLVKAGLRSVKSTRWACLAKGKSATK